MYRSFHQAMLETYGKKLYKLSLDGGMTCPNRDGTCGTGGCIFCSADGAGTFSAPRTDSIRRQLDHAKAILGGKAAGCGYIAYFQNFSNTHAPVSRLRELFTETIVQPDVDILDIATRPDCLPPDVLVLLSELQQIKPVWVELGLQTIHPETASYIRRGYPLSCFDAAMADLQAANIPVIVHMILGLPGETPEMIRETAAYIGASGAAGIKFHLLHVLRGTDLAAEYARGAFDVLSLEAYTQLLIDCIRRIPPEMVVHRLTGDGPKSLLLAPLWSGDKKRVLNFIQRAFAQQNLVQGDLFAPLGCQL